MRLCDAARAEVFQQMLQDENLLLPRQAGHVSDVLEAGVGESGPGTFAEWDSPNYHHPPQLQLSVFFQGSAAHIAARGLRSCVEVAAESAAFLARFDPGAGAYVARNLDGTSRFVRLCLFLESKEAFLTKDS